MIHNSINELITPISLINLVYFLSLRLHSQS